MTIDDLRLGELINLSVLGLPDFFISYESWTPYRCIHVNNDRSSLTYSRY